MLIEHAVNEGRDAKENLKIGICGEHGGDPDSVEFCHRQGFNYVSCSAFRVPIARLAAAQGRRQGRLGQKNANKRLLYTKTPPKRRGFLSSVFIIDRFPANI